MSRSAYLSFVHSLIASSGYHCFFSVISFGQTDHLLPFWPNFHRATKVASALYVHMRTHATMLPINHNFNLKICDI